MTTAQTASTSSHPNHQSGEMKVISIASRSGQHSSKDTTTRLTRLHSSWRYTLRGGLPSYLPIGLMTSLLWIASSRSGGNPHTTTSCRPCSPFPLHLGTHWVGKQTEEEHAECKLVRMEDFTSQYYQWYYLYRNVLPLTIRIEMCKLIDLTSS